MLPKTNPWKTVQNSFDVNDCEKAFNSNEDVEIKVFGTQLLITNSISTGITNGLISSGYKLEHLELTAALKIALTKFNLAEKYLSGQQVFREARLGEKNN